MDFTQTHISTEGKLRPKSSYGANPEARSPGQLELVTPGLWEPGWIGSKLVP